MSKIELTAESRTVRLSDAETPEISLGVLCLRIGTATFGICFFDLENAREAAHHIILSGRDVEIFEKASGNVVEVLKGLDWTPRQSLKPINLASRLRKAEETVGADHSVADSECGSGSVS